MNILNLPAPTAGAEFGQALGELLGQGLSTGLGVYTRNKAMDYLNESFPRTETIDGTNVEGPQFYTQKDKEQAIRNAPFYLRSQINQLMEQRNQSAGQEIENANIYKNLATEILTQFYPTADPQTQQLFGDRAIRLYRQGLNTAQVNTILTQEARKLGDSLASFAKSPEVSFNPFKRAYESVKGTFIPPEQLKENLSSFAKPFIELGEFDVFRRLGSEKNFRPVEVEEILGYKISPQVTSYLSKELKNLRPETLENQIEEVFKIDPNTNVVLLREKFVNTGKVGFADFLNAVSKLQNEQRIKLEKDQRNQLGVVQRPEKDILRKAKEFLVESPKLFKPGVSIGVGGMFRGKK